MPSYTAGTAYLRIAPSLRGLHSEINRELRSITPEPVVTVRIQPEWRNGTRIPIPPPSRDTEVRVPVRAEVDKKSFADATNAVALLQRNLLTLAKPVAAAFAVPAVVGFAGAVGEAAKITALLPGVIAVAAGAVATYKVGVSGLADAFKAVRDGDPEKIAEAMAKLSPSARTLVTEVMRISPAFKSMQLEVQETLLKRVGVEFSALALRYLPVVRTGLIDTAKWMNIFGRNMIEAASNSRSVESVKSIFADTALSARQFSDAGTFIVHILLDIAKVGAEFLPSFADAFSDAAENAAVFIAKARDSGQLKIWIQDGINAVRDFIKIFINLGVTISNVLDAAGLDGFLASLLNITQKMRDWSESATGVEQTRDLFSSLSDLGTSLAPKIATIAGTVIKIIEAVGPAIKPLAQGVTDVVAAAGPAVELFTTLAVSILPPLGAALSFLAPVLGPVVAAFLAAGVAVKVWSLVTSTAMLIQRGFAVTMAIVNGVIGAYRLIVAIVTGYVRIWATAQLLLNMAMAANPLGLVVIAVAAFVAIIVLAWTHSETFRNIVIGAWEGIKAAAVAVWGWLTTVVFPSFMTAATAVGNFFVMLWQQWIVPAWEGIKAAFVVGGQVLSAVWDGIVFAAKLAFVVLATIVITPLYLLWQGLSALFMWGYETLIKPAWEGITLAVSTAWAFIEPIFVAIKDWLIAQLVGAFNFYRDAAIAAWNLIKDGINIAWIFIRDTIWQPIVDFINTLLVPTGNFLRDQSNAAWEAIRAGIDVAWVFIRDNIWQPILDFINAFLIPGMLFWRDNAVAAWEAIRAGIDVAWVWIRDQIWNPIVVFITQTLPNGFQTGVDAIGRLWDGIKAKLRDPLQAAIDVVWNNGIVKVWNMVADLVGLGQKLSPYNLPGFAAGGPITGGTPGKDSVLLRAMPGEFIFSKAAVESMGGMGVVEQIHNLFRGGGPVRAVTGGARGLPGYQTGGPVVPGPVNPLAMIGDIFGALTSAIAGLGRLAGGAGQWGQAVVGFGTKIGTAVLENLQAKVAAWVASFIGIGGGGAAGPGGRVIVGGGSGRAFIIARESGGNPTARNPTSTASGLYQFINGTWKAYGGSTPTAAQASVAEQNAVADRYVASRYGGWAGAEAFWRANHWYDQGGVASGRGLMAKGVIQPERVLSNRQTKAFEMLVGSLTGSGAASRLAPDHGDALGAGTPTGGSFIGQLVVSPQPGDSVQDVLDAAMTRARHEFNTGRYGRR